ncbi:signal transduction histidine kinase (STHK), LytS [Leptolyngbya sp. KIOST-1]|uniref:signal transduction histidine kinase (STHK), LytS n=1 Tax=Leptolyngbya sp. KIOST-1 TaxID=1229172 RepID=UPI001CEE0753|nr:signal transduction histidine kinase (STHK), LytS [Leptolyngbya sp. KIOST-1]
MDNVSIIGQDSEHLNQSGRTGTVQVQDIQADDGNHADDGATTGALSGGAVGGLTGLLVGLGTLAIPGVGPIMLAGAAATALASTVAGGAIGAATGGLVGGLVGMGIPEDRAKVYDEHLSQGKYLVIIDGTAGDMARAEPILKRRDIREWNVYTMADRSATTHNRPTPPRGVDSRGVDPRDAAGMPSGSR